MGHNDFGKRFQTGFTGHLGACTSFRFVGKIDVLELRGVERSEDTLLEFGCEFLLAAYGFKDICAPLFEFGTFGRALLDAENRHLVHIAGGFLTVAADERDCSAIGKKVDDGRDVGRIHSEFPGNDGVGRGGVLHG